jgi:universal stress protein E
MARPRIVLVALDGSETGPAAWQRGAALARKLRAALYVEHFGYGGSLARAATVESPELAARMRAELDVERARLDAEAEPLRRDGLTVVTGASWGAPIADAINARAKALKPLAVLYPVGDAPGLDRLWRTPLAWQLLRECPAPVALLSAHASTVPKRIIAAVDPGNQGGKPSELNLRILRTAKLWARTFKARLHVVHAFQTPTVAAGFGETATLPIVLDEQRRARLAAFEALCDAQHIPTVRRHFIDGAPAAVLAEFAGQTATDLVVLGTVERGFVGRALLGSTAERVLYDLRCDVLALKPKPFRPHRWVEPVVTTFGA